MEAQRVGGHYVQSPSLCIKVEKDCSAFLGHFSDPIETLQRAWHGEHVIVGHLSKRYLKQNAVRGWGCFKSLNGKMFCSTWQNWPGRMNSIGKENRLRRGGGWGGVESEKERMCVCWRVHPSVYASSGGKERRGVSWRDREDGLLGNHSF